MMTPKCFILVENYPQIYNLETMYKYMSSTTFNKGVKCNQFLPVRCSPPAATNKCEKHFRQQ